MKILWTLIMKNGKNCINDILFWTRTYVIVLVYNNDTKLREEKKSQKLFMGTDRSDNDSRLIIITH